MNAFAQRRTAAACTSNAWAQRDQRTKPDATLHLKITGLVQLRLAFILAAGLSGAEQIMVTSTPGSNPGGASNFPRSIPVAWVTPQDGLALAALLTSS